MHLGTILLFTTSIIWGVSFLFQKVAMENLGPFYFNGFKFLLGAMTIFPFVFFSFFLKKEKKTIILYGSMLGFVLFLASCLQQIGIAYTTVNKAAFITGIYICFVPLLGFFFKNKTKYHQYFSILLAIFGFYFLTVKKQLTFELIDSILLLGAICWALHIILIDNFVKKIGNILSLAFIQFLFTSIFSLIAGFFFEEISLIKIQKTALEIIFSGVLSVAIAFTIQLKAQSLTHPVYSSLVLSTEAVFASIFAFFFLAERMTARELLGCFFILLAIIFCQISPKNIYQLFKRKLLE